jgi:hypothetical protein
MARYEVPPRLAVFFVFFCVLWPVSGVALERDGSDRTVAEESWHSSEGN